MFFTYVITSRSRSDGISFWPERIEDLCYITTSDGHSLVFGFNDLQQLKFLFFFSPFTIRVARDHLLIICERAEPWLRSFAIACSKTLLDDLARLDLSMRWSSCC